MSFISLIKKRKRLLQSIVFVAIVLFLFSRFTYLFRNAGNNRDRVVGIKNQKNIDMIYVGGSVTFVFWNPFLAYSNYGFTSYNLATDSLQAESIQAYLEYARLYHENSIFVIDASPFMYYSDDVDDSGIRNSSDSMSIWLPIRYKLLYKYFKNRGGGEKIDRISYYFDIALYHNNISNLTSRSAWRYINNTSDAVFTKGFDPQKKWEYISEPKDFKNDEKKELSDNAKKVLFELLDYCSSNNLKVLFVVSPNYIEYDTYSMYNSIEDIIKTYGYEFLNANDYYEEMNIDFATDYYNVGHVNALGAEKYTMFLADYLSRNYPLQDHRGEKEFEEWDIDSETYKNDFEDIKTAVWNIIEYGNEEGEEANKCVP